MFMFVKHYGHEHRLGHLRIPMGQCQALAGQIAQGVTFEHILDQIRDSVCQRFERVHLLTRKDLSNIEHLDCEEVRNTKMMQQVLDYGYRKCKTDVKIIQSCSTNHKGNLTQPIYSNPKILCWPYRHHFRRKC